MLWGRHAQPISPATQISTWRCSSRSCRASRRFGPPQGQGPRPDLRNHTRHEIFSNSSRVQIFRSGIGYAMLCSLRRDAARKYPKFVSKLSSSPLSLARCCRPLYMYYVVRVRDRARPRERTTGLNRAKANDRPLRAAAKITAHAGREGCGAWRGARAAKFSDIRASPLGRILRSPRCGTQRSVFR